MKSETFLRFRRLVRLTIVFAYLVTMLGSVVRMSGSGMGCPDWPKCFGYYIPPVHIEQLTWRSNKKFEKGNIIIHNERLYVAKRDFITKDIYFPSNWHLYTRHDYAKFNVYHTYTEYVNRLFGASLGFVNLLMFLYSLSFWRVKRNITLLSLFSVILLVFQAWLGAKVVDSNLLPIKITIHMVTALVMIALYIYILKISRLDTSREKYPKSIFYTIVLTLVLLIVQMIIGIQVRETVDINVKSYGYEQKHLWLNESNWSFIIHRSFSILILFLSIWLYIKNKIVKSKLVNIGILIIMLEIIVGMSMSYFNFPVMSQPLHLLLSFILFGILFYKILVTKPV